MNWLDVTILSIIGISALISLFRGFTREVLSLAGWIAAFWVAFKFYDQVEPLLQPHIQALTPRLVVAGAILFLVTLILAGILNYLVVQLVQKTGLGGTDRAIGMLFGFARGCAIVAILVLLGGLTPMPKDYWWQESQLMRYFEQLVLQSAPYLPPELAQNVRFSYPPASAPAAPGGAPAPKAPPAPAAPVPASAG